ncbi:aspartate/glutamate racemase family protein [Paraburkholderia diazotrophica]|uniref:Asp/Glu/hydantoin racemase n=1 Tax=Paraburkholderia diazotrophica TaxID=667676 RepID=A0A1H7EK68_9BURK|nr:hypothetical protein [Paraburkholderia diazotrophica]SEK13467.1 hypothetical protein SAMN05192539_10692 [Paraburkholderia diazotrophica]
MKVTETEQKETAVPRANSSAKRPLLGVIKLDDGDASEAANEGPVMPFAVDDPAYWTVPLCKTIAKGADAAANKVPTPEAARGILEAAQRLDGHTDMIIGGCGYMWASRKHLYEQTSTPVLTSALEFLDLALRMTKLPVGIITWDAVPLMPLLKEYPGIERLRFVTIRDLPDFQKWVLDPCGEQAPCGWSKERIAQQLSDRLSGAFGRDGVFNDVGVLVLECTLMPDFRDTIRALTAIPILDLLSFAKAALQ